MCFVRKQTECQLLEWLRRRVRGNVLTTHVVGPPLRVRDQALERGVHIPLLRDQPAAECRLSQAAPRRRKPRLAAAAELGFNFRHLQPGRQVRDGGALGLVSGGGFR